MLLFYETGSGIDCDTKFLYSSIQVDAVVPRRKKIRDKKMTDGRVT